MKKLFVLVVVTLFYSLTLHAYKPGDVVKNFKLKDTKGKFVSLSDYKDSKGVILIFDCNTCPYSKAYAKRIASLERKFSPKGFPVIAINSNSPEVSPGDSYQKMQERSKKQNIQYPYLFDETQEVAKSYEATRTPEVFLLTKKGNDFVLRYTGAIDNNSFSPEKVTKTYVEDAIEAILNNKKVGKQKTASIGCTIKWKK